MHVQPPIPSPTTTLYFISYSFLVLLQHKRLHTLYIHTCFALFVSFVVPVSPSLSLSISSLTDSLSFSLSLSLSRYLSLSVCLSLSRSVFCRCLRLRPCFSVAVFVLFHPPLSISHCLCVICICVFCLCDCPAQSVNSVSVSVFCSSVPAFVSSAYVSVFVSPSRCFTPLSLPVLSGPVTVSSCFVHVTVSSLSMYRSLCVCLQCLCLGPCLCLVRARQNVHRRSTFQMYI
jgi:hypothetical protein